jgi:hypothetical protein
VPALRILWPLESLKSVLSEAKQRTAVVVCTSGTSEMEPTLIGSGLAAALVDRGVRLFAIVGPDSERIHDSLDWELESCGALDIVTTWHSENDLDDLGVFLAATARGEGFTEVVGVFDTTTEVGAGLCNAIARHLAR